MNKSVRTDGLERQQLHEILGNLEEGVILASQDGSITWANHAALRMHDCNSLAELGVDAESYARNFTLFDTVGDPLPALRTPLFRLLESESFAGLTLGWSRSQSDAPSRTMEFRGMVIREQNNPSNILVLFVLDTTERLRADELFDRFFSSKPAPAAILRLDDWRYVRVNDGFCDLTGYARSELLERPFHEIDVLHAAEAREDALRALASNEVIRQQESRVRTHDGDTRAVIVAGQPIVIDARPCMLFTFIDLEARKRTEQALRQSEERFATAFRMAPVPMLVCVQSNWCVIEVNGAFVSAAGRPRSEIIGYPATQTGLELSHKTRRDISVALESNQMIRHQEVRLRTPDGLEIDGLLAAESVMIQDEACALFVIQDVTEHKRSTNELIDAIEAVMKDATWFSQAVMEKLAQVRRPQAAGSKLEALTGREREVLEWICKGHGDAAIAAALKLSRNTVRNHVAALYGKIGVNRRSAAVVWGRERGFGQEGTG